MSLTRASFGPLGYPINSADLYDRVVQAGRAVGKYAKNEYGGRSAVGPFGASLGRDRRKVPPIKTNMRRVNGSGPSATNGLANRATMVRRNPRKAKSKRGKKVKVSKQLRKKIGQVLKGKKLFGEYNTVRMGTIGTGLLGTDDTTQLSLNLLGMTSQQMNYIPLATSSYTNSKCIWQLPLAPFATTPGIGGVSSGNFRVSDTWAAFFHPMKFLDAASVMWNRKPIDPDWTKPDLNLTTRTDASGEPITNITIPQNIKIDVVNSYVNWEMKNNSKRELTVEIYHIYGKHKLSSATSLQSLIQSLSIDLPTAPNNGPLLSNEATPEFLLDIQLKPGDIPAFNQNFKYETITVKIKPGETCKHSLQGPRNIEMDLAKLYAPSNVEGLSQMPKGVVSVLMCVYGDLQVADTTFQTGHFIPRANNTDSTLKNPLSVKWSECFKLRIPEQAGFVSRSLPAVGSGVPLTLRRPIKAFGDFSQINLPAASSYTGNDEENPSPDITESSRF
ncbi:MAG: putative capsid protein [Arizlama virus AZLM_25953]|nr:MAG: putative capsid protein [Arizlama virus]